MKLSLKTCCFLTPLIAILLMFGTNNSHAEETPTLTPDSSPVKQFIGNVASPKSVTTSSIPQNPFMAANGRGNAHNDSYMSDTYLASGPLGNKPSVSTINLGGVCITVTFDQKGRIVTLCLNQSKSALHLVDPVTLNALADLELPSKKVESMTDVPPGSYFYLDQNDHAWLATIENTIWEVAIADTASGAHFERENTYDLSQSIDSGDSVTSVLPDFSGRLWFVSKQGTVGTFNRQSSTIKTIKLKNEAITNSFALDETGGVFIVSDHAMYRFDADQEGQPVVTWREAYDRGSKHKPGQFAQGSGTTPTLMGSDFVTITDNAEPQMQVLVYKRQAKVDGSRLVCAVPVFASGKSDTENSLIATDKSIIVENNYGYTGPLSTVLGKTTEPGISRIDLDVDGQCHTVWTSTERVPNIISKLSLSAGLIYTYTKDEGPSTTDAWYFSAVDFETGKTVFKQLTGTILGYNSHYAGLYLGPDGTAYAGVLRGLVAVRDRP